MTLRFDDGRIMVIELDVTEEQRRMLTPVAYLRHDEGEEVLATLKAWFPASFVPSPMPPTRMRASGGW